MSDRKHILLALGLFFGVSALGVLLLAWPNYREVLKVDREIADLRGRIDSLDQRSLEMQRLAERMHAVQRRVREELRMIPASPDLADLMRALSMRVDNETIIDQTFTAGSAVPALPNEEGSGASENDSRTSENPPMAMLLTIDLAATFDAAFSLISATESIDRLVRISTLRLHCDRNERNGERQEPLLIATIGLEAIYAPE